MEYCEGGELFDYIVQKQHLTERQSCAFFHEIIDALEYLHSINIVHRDIKPENLLLDKINKKISLKLIDFGISNIYNMQNLLKTPCGTASYAPPEMHKGEKYYGLLTDIWSSGVVLYAMAFGYLPFCDDDEEINVTNIIEGNYEIPSSASPELYDLLIHLLDINPLTRYDIDQIKVHPWYNMISTNTNRPGLIVGYHKIPIDERIINVCQTYGYDANKVRESVINNSYDNNSSIYYIILNKMKAMGIESISDLNSPEFLNYINDPKNIFFSKANMLNNNPNLTNENKSSNHRKNNNILKNDNHINLQLVTSFDSLNSINNNKQKQYENILPDNKINFCLNSNEEIENQMKINNNKEEKDLHNEIEERNESAPNISKDLINTDKEEKMNNSSEKNNNYKRKIRTTNRNKDKKKKLFIISQMIDIPSENIKKKKSKKTEKKEKKKKKNN
jgi:5'-AMP-activated protein kinase catalytic alpha subunit